MNCIAEGCERMARERGRLCGVHAEQLRQRLVVVWDGRADHDELIRGGEQGIYLRGGDLRDRSRFHAGRGVRFA